MAAADKIITADEAAMYRELCRGIFSVAFTNGCFDLLHAGHVHLLEGAARHADRLFVGINSDASVARLKPGRPIVRCAERALLVAALASVHVVVIFDEDAPEDLIERLRPDTLVKGSSTWHPWVGEETVRSYGGRIRAVPELPGYSTTARIAEVLHARKLPAG